MFGLTKCECGAILNAALLFSCYNECYTNLTQYEEFNFDMGTWALKRFDSLWNLENILVYGK